MLNFWWLASVLIGACQAGDLVLSNDENEFLERIKNSRFRPPIADLQKLEAMSARIGGAPIKMHHHYTPYIGKVNNQAYRLVDIVKSDVDLELWQEGEYRDEHDEAKAFTATTKIKTGDVITIYREEFSRTLAGRTIEDFDKHFHRSQIGQSDPDRIKFA